MFTGLVEELGLVLDRSEEESGVLFRIRTTTCSSDLTPGDSIAVNGVCQTVVRRDGTDFDIFAIPETLNRTTFGALSSGMKVNLELPLRMGDRLGGHWVTGHVDAPGEIAQIVTEGGTRSFQIRTSRAHGSLLVEKGSITVDGVSLTVGTLDDVGPRVAGSVHDGGSPDGNTFFWVHIIPETWERTLFGAYVLGHEVNLEFDLLGKYILRAHSLEANTPVGTEASEERNTK